MNVVLIRSNLKEGLSAVERASGVHANLPILKNVRLEAMGGKLRLSATNLEIAISASVSAKVLAEGSITVPADLFSALIGSLPSERLSLEVKGTSLHIVTDNYEGSLIGTSAEDFPIIPQVQNKDVCIEIEGGVLKDALGQVAAASQSLDLRPELSSILCDFTLDSLKFVATDSFRLAEKTLSKSVFHATNSEAAEEFTALIPLKAVQELLRIIKNDDAVRLARDASQLFITTETVEFVSRLADGTFPDYSAVVPQELSSELIIDRQELINAVKLASVLGSRTSEVKLTVVPTKKSLEVSSADQATGENRSVLAAKIVGEEATISFNWRYLMDGLRVLKNDDISLGLYQENKKAILKDAGDGSYFYILVSLIQ